MAEKKKFWNWRELIGLGALAYLGSQLDKTTEKNEELEEENDELQTKLDRISEKLGIDIDDLDDLDDGDE